MTVKELIIQLLECKDLNKEVKIVIANDNKGSYVKDDVRRILGDETTIFIEN